MENSSQSFEQNKEILEKNLNKIAQLTQRLTAAMGASQTEELASPIQAPDLNLDLYGKAYSQYLNGMMNNPAKMIEQQAGFWEEAVKNWSALTSANLDNIKAGGEPQSTTPAAQAAKPKRVDRRFKSALWQDNQFYAALAQTYESTAASLQASFDSIDWEDKEQERRAAFFTQQYISLLSPTNFLPTNPEALDLAVRTNGESLLRGLENLVNDVEQNNGRYGVSLSDDTAFTLGENVATSEGQVVFQNRMFQLIQYSPSTKTVCETPLMIVPPWINKYYILDLQPENSFIKYAVDSGLTVFVVSWVNPDENSGDIHFSDYMTEGTLVALKQVMEITQQPQVNTIGYCIGGTLMTCTMAWLAQSGLSPVKSNTFFTTLIDFEEPGELGVFIDPAMIKSMEDRSASTGIVDAYYMGQIFSYLRPDNLVYGPAVKSYMMGEKPPAFDLLFWNEDSPNLPGLMVSQYLRALYMDNRLIKGEFVFGNEIMDVSKIDVPIYAIAANTDHIAPWKSSFKGLNQLGSASKRFILAGSGHIAGVINPAGSTKYGYKTNDAAPDDLQAWEAGATQHEGSWWADWQDWIIEQSGKSVPARIPGGPNHPIIEPAPGSYVKKPA